jgi:prepilin-type N-terminal cleavage/methylation domain-containing protein
MNCRKARNRRSGLTLVELLVSLVIMTLMAAAIAGAFAAGIDAERHHRQDQNDQTQVALMEQHLTTLLAGAILGATTDRTTYFIGDDVGDTLQPLPTTGITVGGASSSPNDAQQSGGQSSQTGTASTTVVGATRLTFTTVAPNIPIRARTDSDDFETQQQKYGPIGGTAEIEWATTAEGDAGDKTGLFERMQRPSDGDPSQGGKESVLTPQVKAIGFQFWDGTQWLPTWNSTASAANHRLPAAVEVDYQLTTDTSNIVHTFVVPIPNSDVTALNPMQTSTGTTTGGT